MIVEPKNSNYVYCIPLYLPENVKKIYFKSVRSERLLLLKIFFIYLELSKFNQVILSLLY